MQKAILVTGASTGIGHHLAHYLAERDHLVYAGVRKETDFAALSSSKNIVPLKLDVTDLGQIETAVTYITAQGTGLYGLVNNAGLGGLGHLTSWSEAEFLKRLEGSPIRRIGHQRWLRNIAVALGNARNEPTLTRTLASRLNSSSGLVAEHVAWALSRHMQATQSKTVAVEATH